MGQPDPNCINCGAPVRGIICEHCGRPTARLGNPSEENRALDEFHKLLKAQKAEEQRKWLEAGFLPDDREVLVEAGINCLPFLQNMSVYTAAASRLEAIILKLELMHGDRKAREAVENFRKSIAEYVKRKRKDDLYGMGCLLLILAAMVAVGWWLIYDAGLSVGVPLVILMVGTVAWLILKK